MPGDRFEWIFMSSSEALCLPCMHGLAVVVRRGQRVGRVLQEKLHCKRGVMLLQMEQNQRNIQLGFTLVGPFLRPENGPQNAAASLAR